MVAPFLSYMSGSGIALTERCWKCSELAWLIHSTRIANHSVFGLASKINELQPLQNPLMFSAKSVRYYMEERSKWNLLL